MKIYKDGVVIAVGEYVFGNGRWVSEGQIIEDPVIDKWNALKAILASDEDVNDEWVLSDNLNRTYPLVLGMAQALGISDEELDTLFIEASKLS